MQQKVNRINYKFKSNVIENPGVKYLFKNGYITTTFDNDIKLVCLNEKEIFNSFSIIELYVNIGGFTKNSLCDDAYKSFCIDNAGGNSYISEGCSINYFKYRFKTFDFIFEKNVEYRFYGCSMVDYICSITTGNKIKRIGVSVTRAMNYSDPSKFNKQEADRLIFKKLNSLIVARDAVSKKHRFHTCFLHVFTMDKRIAELISISFDENKKYLEIEENVILLCTIVSYDSLIFTETAETIKNIIKE